MGRVKQLAERPRREKQIKGTVLVEPSRRQMPTWEGAHKGFIERNSCEGARGGEAGVARKSLGAGCKPGVCESREGWRGGERPGSSHCGAARGPPWPGLWGPRARGLVGRVPGGADMVRIRHPLCSVVVGWEPPRSVGFSGGWVDSLVHPCSCELTAALLGAKPP